MPGSRALPGWFSHFPFQWAAVLPASAGHSPHHPQSELLALASGDILQEPLNKAVNEEVSSLYPSGSHPSPKYPHLRASFFANPSLLQGWTQPALMALSLLPGHLHREAWLCPTHLGTEQSTTSLLTPRACSTFFVLWDGADPLARAREVAPLLLTTDGRLVVQKWCQAQDQGRTGCCQSSWVGHRLPPPLLLNSAGCFRAQATGPYAQRRQPQLDWNVMA